MSCRLFGRSLDCWSDRFHFRDHEDFDNQSSMNGSLSVGWPRCGASRALTHRGRFAALKLATGNFEGRGRGDTNRSPVPLRPRANVVSFASQPFRVVRTCRAARRERWRWLCKVGGMIPWRGANRYGGGS